MAIHVDPDWWKSLFDDVYLVTDARSVCDEDLTRREVDVITGLVPIGRDDRVLDLCGGHGRHSLELSRRGAGQCTVFDFSGTLLDRGREEAARKGIELEFVQGEADCTGLPDAAFDHVLVLGNSLGYVPGEEGDRRILREAFRVVRQGGSFLLDVTDGAAVRERFSPNAWHEVGEDMVICRQRELLDDCIRAREVVVSKTRGLVRDSTYAIRIYEPGQLIAMVEEAGFESVSGQTGLSRRESEGDYGFMNHRIMITARRART